MSDFIIDPEFESYLPPRDEATSAEQESLLLEEGIKDALIVGLIEDEGKEFLLDGFGRYKVATKHNLPFKTRKKKFATRADALYYMDRLQRSRRNFSELQKSLCIQRMATYLHSKKESTTRGSGEVALQIAADLGMAERTVYRHLQAGEALQSLPKDLRDRIVSGELKAARTDVIELASLSEAQQRQVFIEADQDGEKDLGVVIHGTIDLEEMEQKGQRGDLSFATKKPVKELRSEALDALGKLSKAVDALNDAEPASARMSAYHSHLEGIRNLLNGWKESVAA
jgi:predicted transcriptional regulator